MAKVKNPLMAEAAVGQLGGLLYRNGTYGPIVSRRSISAVHRTPAQTVQRGYFAAATHAWTELPWVTKHAWDALSVRPSDGRCLFIACYCRLQMMGFASLPLPRRSTNVGSISEVHISLIDGDPPELWVDWQYDGYWELLYAAYYYPTYSGRTSPKPRKLTYVGSGAAMDAGGAWPVKCTSPVGHLRIELVEPTSGMLVGKSLYREVF